ncbi:MAG: hypothetical protein ACK4XK_04055 [Casimicrobiaceae bacterium]
MSLAVSAASALASERVPEAGSSSASGAGVHRSLWHDAAKKGRAAAALVRGWLAEPALRWAFAGGILAVLGVIALVLVAQLLLLGAWRFGLASEPLGFEPAPASPLQRLPTGEWRLPPDRTTAGIVANRLALDARAVPGLRLKVEAQREPIEIEIGWTRLGGGERPATLRYRLPPSAHDRTVRLQLVGAREWDGTITRLALVVRAPTAVGSLLTFGAPEPIPATPSAALAWLAEAALADRPALRAQDEARGGAAQAARVLPAAVWLGAVFALLWLGYAVAGRQLSPRVLAAALVGSAAALMLVGFVLGIGALMLQVLPARGTLLGLLATAALILAQIQRGAPSRAAVLALVTAVLVLTWLEPGLGAASAWAVGLLATPGRWADRVRRGAVAVLGLVTLGVAAHAQGLTARLFPVDALPLVDPTSALLGFLPWALPPLGVTFGALLLASHWPRARPLVAMDARALTAAAGFAGLLVLSLALGAPGQAGYLLPLAVLIGLALLPRLAAPLPERRTPAATTLPLTERSAAVQSMYAAVVGAFLNAAARRDWRDAHRQLDRLAEIAPEHSETHWARVALSVAGVLTESRDRLAAAESYRALLALRATARPPALLVLKPEQFELTLAEAAWAADDLPALAALAETMPPGLARLRVQARSALAEGGPAQLWRWLAEHGFPPELMLERIECAFLLDDLEAAKAALDASGIPIQSPAGQCYYQRMLLRARGPSFAEAEILKQVTWYPQLAPAQMAMAELLAAKGELDAARVRTAQAERCEAAFWPAARLERRGDPHAAPGASPGSAARQGSSA